MAQEVYKFRAYELMTTEATPDGDWIDWSEPTTVNILTIIDTNKERITIYSKETQVYDIVKGQELMTEEIGMTIFEFMCVDKDGNECLLLMRSDDHLRIMGIGILYESYSWYYSLAKI